MSDKFEQLNLEDVVSGFVVFLNFPRTWKVNELFEAVKIYFNDKSSTKLFGNGLELEVLRLDGKGWRKGRVRFSLEFCPDELTVREKLSSNEETAQPESTLDDIRKMMKEDSQQRNL